MLFQGMHGGKRNNGDLLEEFKEMGGGSTASSNNGDGTNYRGQQPEAAQKQ
jgi:hypothetical protein